MAAAGIELVDSDVPVLTDAIFTLTTAQAANLAVETDSHTGLLGGTLDAAGGESPSAIPFSAMVAGYVRGVQTPAAEYARTVMVDQDLTHPDTAVFPMLVLALFAADAASAFAADEAAAGTTPTTPTTPSSSHGFTGSGPGTGVRILGGLCSDITKAIFDGVEKVFEKIQIPEIKIGNTGSSFLNGLLQGLADVVVGSINFVLTAAKTLIIKGVEFVLGKILGFVAQVAAAAALVSNFVSAIRSWRLEVTADKPNTEKGIEPTKVYDTVKARAVLEGGNDDWPDWFTDCAKVAGVTLPSLLPVGDEVKWKVVPKDPEPGLLTESADEIPRDDTLQKDSSGAAVANIGLVTGLETQEQADTGEEQHGAVQVVASARRKQLEELRMTLATAVKNLVNHVLVGIPSFITDYLFKIVSDAVESASQDLTSVFDASSYVLIDVLYHGPPRETTTSSSQPALLGDVWSFSYHAAGAIPPSWVGYTCTGLFSTWHVAFEPGTYLERIYDLPFTSGNPMVHPAELVYDFPPAGESPALHLVWSWDYFIDGTVQPPMLRISGTQHETPEGGGEVVFQNNYGTGDGLTLHNESLPKLLMEEGGSYTHPFLTQAQAECGG